MENGQIRIAVVGCCHGELDQIYEDIRSNNERSGSQVDLLLICGDFQAVRNYGDLDQMAVPNKYKQLNTFYKYYSGEVVAPVLTIFIGGNHEASGFLQELPYGGWVAPNIYYLGYSGVVQFGGLKIAGISGIYKEQDFNKGHYERPPYNEGTKRSCYHTRALDVFRLHHIREDVDIFLSHDWPLGIYRYGNVNALLRAKPYFARDIDHNALGNPHTMNLLAALKPRFWFAAHLHCHFKATVRHGPPKTTEFSALNKVLPGRRYLEIFNVPSKSNQPKRLHYDPEWMAILRRTNQFMSIRAGFCPLPQGQPPAASEQEKQSIRAVFEEDLAIPDNFTHTSPPMPWANQQQPNNGAHQNPHDYHGDQIYVNPQTERLSQLVGIIHPFKEFAPAAFIPALPLLKEVDPNEIDVGGDDDDGGVVLEKQVDPDEINLDEVDDCDKEKLQDPNEIDLGDDDDNDDECIANENAASEDMLNDHHGDDDDGVSKTEEVKEKESTMTKRKSEEFEDVIDPKRSRSEDERDDN